MLRFASCPKLLLREAHLREDVNSYHRRFTVARCYKSDSLMALKTTLSETKVRWSGAGYATTPLGSLPDRVYIVKSNSDYIDSASFFLLLSGLIQGYLVQVTI